ncbi:putative 3-methylbenzoate transporter permease [Azoarcus sp. CIB]|nr:putative 3-methylbenzoate transporter permease [Azoarcus sp. CIB]
MLWAGADMTQQLRRFFLFSAVAGLAIYPLYGGEFYIQLLTKIMVMAVFAMSLDLLVGYAGLVSLGHAAFFGVAGYVAALLMPQYEAGNVWLTLPAALCAATLLALVVGALALRTSGVYFIMVTLALAQMLYYFVHDAEFAGGSDGMLIMLKPEAVIFGWKPFDLNSPAHFYYVVLAVMLGVYFLLRAVLRSSFGHALAGIKSNEHRMRSLGFPVYRYKLAAFTLAGTVAGLAGYLGALQFGFVNPELLGWHQSGNVLMMVILGGMGSLTGPVTGAFTLVLLQEFLTGLTKHWQVLMGSFIVLVALMLPHGLSGFSLTRYRLRAHTDTRTTPEKDHV